MARLGVWRSKRHAAAATRDEACTEEVDAGAGPVVKQATRTHSSSAWRDAQRSEWCTHQQQRHKAHIEGGVQAVGRRRGEQSAQRGVHIAVRAEQGKMVSLSVNFN
jgi:hypothetical protein